MSAAERPLLHIVGWRLNGADAAERVRQGERIVQAFEACRTTLPGLLRLEAGCNVVEAADAWDVAVCMVFATRAHLDAYQQAPAHLAIKALVGPLRSARAQIDIELPAGITSGADGC